MVGDKQTKLDKITNEICRNAKSREYGSGQCVPGEGNPDANIFFAGEAPGYHESIQGRPFVGQAGKLLEKLLASIGLRREDVFIGNVIHFRPPNNRDPEPTEVEAEKPYLLKQIEVVDPKIVASLGRFALNVFLPEAKISRDHGKVFKLGRHLLFPLYHPAAALRSGQVLKELENDFEKLGRLYKLETGQIETQIKATQEESLEDQNQQMQLF